MSILIHSWETRDSPSTACYYKKVGEANADTSEDDGSDFNKEDFLLVLQTPSQAEIFRANARTLCVDATHGITGYGFYLLTIMVVDEHGKGFPVAWAITSRENALIWQLVASSIERKSGHYSPEVMMADDANSAWNGCRAVWPTLKHKLLCHWHIKKNIRLHCFGPKSKVQVVHHQKHPHEHI